MSDYNQDTNTPCPPVLADYEGIVGGEPGNWGVVPVNCQFNTFYSTDYILNVHSGVVGVVFRKQLESGKTYEIVVETSVTQPGFNEEVDVIDMPSDNRTIWIGGLVVLIISGLLFYGLKKKKR